MTLFSHMLELKHTFNFPHTTLIKPMHYKKSRRRLESAVISKTNHIKQHPGFYQISPCLADIMLHEEPKYSFWNLWSNMFVYKGRIWR